MPPTRKYNIVYVDPPWRYNDKGCEGAASTQYGTMSLKELVELKSTVKEMAARDCVLLMWVTWPMLKEGLHLIQEWGFNYKTLFIEWIKLTKNRLVFFGTGHYAKSNSEIILFGTRGRITAYPRGNFESQIMCEEPSPHAEVESQLLVTVKREHSRKPEEAKRRIVSVFGDLPRIEMFARGPSQGWDVWGNEVGKFGGMLRYIVDPEKEKADKEAQDVLSAQLHVRARTKKRERLQIEK